jgi:hypothetical protein
MKTEQGSCVDIINVANDRTAVRLPLKNELSLVKLDPGAFKLRVHVHTKADVRASLDGKEVLHQLVQPGIYVFDKDDSGNPLEFIRTGEGLEEFNAARAVPHKVDPDLADLGLEEDSTFTEDGRNRLEQPFRGHSGRFELVLTYMVEDSGKDYEKGMESVAFQFNPAEDHFKAVAANVHLYSATKDPNAGATPAICGCCNHK